MSELIGVKKWIKASGSNMPAFIPDNLPARFYD